MGVEKEPSVRQALLRNHYLKRFVKPLNLLPLSGVINSAEFETFWLLTRHTTKENTIMKISHHSQMFSGVSFGDLTFDLEGVSARLWREIKNVLQTFAQNQAANANQAEYLVNLMAALHSDCDGKTPFLFALQQANNATRGDGAWSKQLLFQDDEMYLELITYFADYPTPIHDHPGSSIVNLLLSGRLCIEYYTNGHAALESSYPIAKVRRTETHTYGAFEASMCFPWQKNLQEIRAISERCVVLSAGLKPDGKQENSWYLPISPQNTDNFFVQRLRRNE